MNASESAARGLAASQSAMAASSRSINVDLEMRRRHHRRRHRSQRRRKIDADRLIGGGARRRARARSGSSGRDVSRLPASERARAGIGRTYQIPRPFLDMTVEENLEVAQYSIAAFRLRCRGARGARGAAEPHRPRRRRTHCRLARCRCCAASGSKSLARSRLKPRLLLLDEVGAGLIDSEITELIELIRSIIDAGTAIVIVEHVIRDRARMLLAH